GGIDAAQHEAHGLAWTATYVEALRQMFGWAERLAGEERLGEIERLILDASFSEYCAQIAGGIPMSQGELVRAGQLGASSAEISTYMEAVAGLVHQSFGAQSKARLASLILADPTADLTGDPGLDVEMDLVRAQFRRFGRERVEPYAHGWHMKDELIPLE